MFLVVEFYIIKILLEGDTKIMKLNKVKRALLSIK